MTNGLLFEKTPIFNQINTKFYYKNGPFFRFSENPKKPTPQILVFLVKIPPLRGGLPHHTPAKAIFARRHREVYPQVKGKEDIYCFYYMNLSF